MPDLRQMAQSADLHRSVIRAGDDPARCPLFKFLDGWFPGRADLRLLEIGTCRGVSAALLAQRGNVVTLDLNHKPEVEQNLAAFGVTGAGRVVCLYGNPATARAKVAGRFDAAFIDGEHSYAAVREDIRFARQFTDRIILHDYFPRFAGVMKAINEAGRTARRFTTDGIFAALEF